MTVIALVITIPLGVKAMVIGHVITSALSFIINTYLPGKLFGYGAVKQFKDMIPVLIATFGMAVLIVLIQMVVAGLLLQLILSGFFGLLTYLGICHLLQVEEVFELRQLLLNFKKK